MQKYKISKMNSDLPFIQNRKQLRAISVQQIFEKVKKQSEKNDNEQGDIGLLKKMSVKNLNYDYQPQTERKEDKLRSTSLTHRLQRSKGSEGNLISLQKNQIQTYKPISYTNNKQIDIKITKEGLQLNKIEQHRKRISDALNQITITKNNQNNQFQDYSNKKFSNLIQSTNNLLSNDSSRQSQKKPQIIKQYEFEQQLNEGPILSFRQFAKLQGFKLPSFLQ